MRKYIGLISSLIMISLSGFTLYHMNQPRNGPIGDGNISPINGVANICLLIAGLLFLTYNTRRFFTKD